MVPMAVNNTSNGNGVTALKPTARASNPAGTPDPSRYHASSSKDAISIEAEYAAHNYHPLPVVFARASGVSVWDPVRNFIAQVYRDVLKID